MGRRRTARIAAMQMLFQHEFNPAPAEEAERVFWTSLGTVLLKDFDDPDRIREFANGLFEGVLAHLGEIDALIQDSSTNWRLERMAVVDRNIIRVAVYELTRCRDIPKKVSVNEAIELGKSFGSLDSGAFINGVLDRILHGVDKE